MTVWNGNVSMWSFLVKNNFVNENNQIINMPVPYLWANMCHKKEWLFTKFKVYPKIIHILYWANNKALITDITIGHQFQPLNSRNLYEKT